MKEIELLLKKKNETKLPIQFGIFFEDLNHAADGGLYGELVRNRSFEFDSEDNKTYHSLTAWKVVERGDSMITVHTEQVNPLNSSNPHYLVIEGTKIDKSSGIQNEGYNSGIPIQKGKTYYFSCFARADHPSNHKLLVQLEDKTGTHCYGSAKFGPLTTKWTKYTCCLKASETDYSGRLSVLLQFPDTVTLDMISLFPADTFQGRENGLRKDLAEMLASMTPRFVRFPGGCITHVGSLNSEDRSSLYRWKNTIHPVEERPSKRNNIWNYNQTLGLGFYELFLLCEDLHAESFPVISAGYDPHFLRKASKEKMQEWIDEALDLIEFANGTVETKWGKLRAQMGHPESFHLKYLTIGNEEVGDGYFENFELIYNAVRKTHPEIKLINSAICGSWNGKFETGLDQAIRVGADYTDIHNYSQPEWFLANKEVYQHCPNSTKFYLGEYSTCGETWHNALFEAAFLADTEKAGSVAFACYAPLFNNVDYCNWKPDLIHFNNHQVYGTPSYYVQKLFMNHSYTELIDTEASFSQKEEKLQHLTGNISFESKGADIEIRHFYVSNKETGFSTTPINFQLQEDNKSYDCEGCTSDRYEIHFLFKKKTGGGYLASRGKCALSVFFAKDDEHGHIEWNIDGWQRLTSLSGRLGRSNMQFPITIELDKEYEACIVVDGGRAQAYIDGILCNEIVCRELTIQDLYYSAGIADNDLIVKLVNLKQEEREISICLDEHLLERYKKQFQVSIFSMTGYENSEENSLDVPKNVVPKLDTDLMLGNTYKYKLDGNSFVVLRLHQLEEQSFSQNIQGGSIA